MMYNVGTLMAPVSPTTPQASVASVIATQQPALGRLTPVSISATVPYTNFQNDARSAQSYVNASPEISAAASAASAEAAPDSAPYFASGRIASFPSLFLAQVIAQGDVEAGGMVNAYEMMMAASEVKYKPSDAGKPSAPSPGLDFLKALQQTQAAPANQNSAPPPPANINQQFSLFTPSEPRLAQKQQTTAPVKPLSPSIGRVRGADAYTLSLVRNIEFAHISQRDTANEALIA
jgi:hypothetical protein